MNKLKQYWHNHRFFDVQLRVGDSVDSHADSYISMNTPRDLRLIWTLECLIGGPCDVCEAWNGEQG